MYSIGLDVHKKTISYCVKDAAGCVHQEGKIGSTRRDLDAWIKTLPQPRTMAMEATIFTGWIYDHLLPHAEAVKVAHPLMLRVLSRARPGHLCPPLTSDLHGCRSLGNNPSDCDYAVVEMRSFWHNGAVKIAKATTLHKRRFPGLAIWMAGLYLIYSLLVYFGTFGGNGHDWWPIFLYPVIWPLSLLIEFADQAIYNSLNPMLNDYVVGTSYIILGTVWIWLVGRLISTVAAMALPPARSGSYSERSNPIVLGLSDTSRR